MNSAGIYGECIKLDPRLEMLPHFLYDNHVGMNFIESSYLSYRVIATTY